MCVCVCVCMNVGACRGQWTDHSGAGVTGRCELPARVVGICLSLLEEHVSVNLCTISPAPINCFYIFHKSDCHPSLRVCMAVEGEGLPGLYVSRIGHL